MEKNSKYLVYLLVPVTSTLVHEEKFYLYTTRRVTSRLAFDIHEGLAFLCSPPHSPRKLVDIAHLDTSMLCDRRELTASTEALYLWTTNLPEPSPSEYAYMLSISDMIPDICQYNWARLL